MDPAALFTSDRAGIIFLDIHRIDWVEYPNKLPEIIDLLQSSRFYVHNMNTVYTIFLALRSFTELRNKFGGKTMKTVYNIAITNVILINLIFFREGKTWMNLLH